MAWNGSGTFNRLYSWIADAAAGLDISSVRMDADTNDIAANGFGNCLTRDGQGQPTANLPMANFRHTGVANGAARTDYAALGQVQDGGSNWAAGGGTADALTAAYTPAITSLVDGQLCFVRSPGTNATAAPTFSPNGLTARAITAFGGSALSPGVIFTGMELILRYRASATRWELLNPTYIVFPGAVMAWGGSAAPAGWALCAGQAISRTTNPVCFANIGTTFGAGDGSTTFNVPDLRGCTIAGPDNMGGSAANRLTTASRVGGWAGLNLFGGQETQTLAAGQIPQLTGSFTSGTENATHTHNTTAVANRSDQGASGGGGGPNSPNAPSAITSGTESATHAHSTTVTLGAGSPTAVVTVQPTLTMNWIIKL